VKHPDKIRTMLGNLYFNDLQRARSMIARMGDNLEVIDKLRQPSDSLTNLLEDLIETTMQHLGQSEKADGTRFSKARRTANKIAAPLRGEGVRS
jgi:hypothetical protein